MADTQYGLFSYSIVDELGTKANITVPVMLDPAVSTPTNMSTEWTTLGGLLDSAIGGQIVGGSMAIVKPADGGWKASPAAGSRVEQTGLLNFLNATTKYKFGVDLPSLKDAAISAGKVNLGYTAISDLITALTTSFNYGVFANTGQYPLTALIDALLTFRKRRKQLSRSSFEVP
jgi:hypothetical protein